MGGVQLHLIRDPVEVCVSSYQYALRSTERWLHAPVAALGGRTYQAYYRASPPRTGLLAECHRCLEELKSTAALYAATARSDATLTLRFEELEAHFGPTVRRAFAFAGALAPTHDDRGAAQRAGLMRAFARHDLARPAAARPPGSAPPNARLATHVSNASQKAPLRALLLDEASGLVGELRVLRAALGYAHGGQPPSGADEATRRRWMLATAAGARAVSR